LPRNPLITLLVAVFFLSGLSSLIYQVAWQRLLTVYYGVGAVSITLIVSVYMFGLGVGSLLGGRLAERSQDPYVLYAVVEVVLGISGLLSFPVILALGRLTVDSPPAVSFVFLFAFLAVPTILMGISLPLLTTIFMGITTDFMYCVSRLYFVNTLGAAVGAILTSYVLVSWLGLNGSIFLAATLDFVLAGAILLSGRQARKVEREAIAETGAVTTAALGSKACALVFVTGFIAIGYEIVCYRVIGVLVKDSPYAFSSILAVYLFGIALGSLAINRCVAGKPQASRRNVFYILQFLLGVTIAITFAGYYFLSKHAPLRSLTYFSFSNELHPSLHLFTRSPGLHSFRDAYLLLDVFLWPLGLTLAPTLLMGASFPLISSLALKRRGCEGSAVGTTYFFMVVGNVLGGLLTGLVMLPVIGTEMTLLAFSSVALLFGLIPHNFGALRVPASCRIAGVSLLLIGSAVVFPRPGDLYAVMHVEPFTPRSMRLQEGLDGVVVTYQDGDQFRNFINGQGHGYRPGPFFLAEAIEGLSCSPSPQNVLVIGFGAGSITETALSLPEVRQVTVVELCGSAIANLLKFPVFASILGDSRVKVVVSDGRRYLERTRERFDVILMDPLRTTSAYSGNLYSRQFFSLAGSRMTPPGILMVGGIGDNPVIRRTLLEEFKYVRAYDGFSLASRVPFHKNLERREKLLGVFPADIQTDIDLFTRNGLEGRALEEATAGYPVNEDWRPISEYYLGLHLRQWFASNTSGAYSDRARRKSGISWSPDAGSALDTTSNHFHGQCAMVLPGP
jgi:predicted membrane-bound spermidine synthase